MAAELNVGEGIVHVMWCRYAGNSLAFDGTTMLFPSLSSTFWSWLLSFVWISSSSTLALLWKGTLWRETKYRWLFYYIIHFFNVGFSRNSTAVTKISEGNGTKVSFTLLYAGFFFLISCRDFVKRHCNRGGGFNLQMWLKEKPTSFVFFITAIQL